MSADWKTLARGAGFRVSADDSIEVLLGPSRQIVHVDDSNNEAIRLWSVIATGKTLEEVAADSYLRYAWERNRLSDLVGFTVDRRQRLVGECWVPLAGLNSGELELHLQELARLCDWHEFRLTGTDAH